MNILVIRFRQMGDAILATVVLNTLRKNYPDATIDFVLNEQLCPLFKGHPAISNLIPFSNDDRHHAFRYMKKVWKTVHQKHYDIIIDMRSTMNTMLFSLFSPTTRHRIGLAKPYTHLVYNFRKPVCRTDESMIDHNLGLLAPLQLPQLERRFTLAISDDERKRFADYMWQQGIDLNRPVMLVGVTAKLENKTWSEERMTEVLQRLISECPDLQLVFNYAPGKEEENARRIYDKLGKPAAVAIDVQARSQRELVAMSSLISCYFGNEGGARHIVHACGKPSLVICAPQNSPTTWIPSDDVVAEGISMPSYDAITVDLVWQRLQDFIHRVTL